MADKTVEIFKGVLSLSDLVDNQANIITAAADKSFVITDIYLNFLQSDTFPISLLVNDFFVGAFQRNATGTEIVQANATAALKLFEGGYEDRVFHIIDTAGDIVEIRFAYIKGYGFLSEPVLSRSVLPYPAAAVGNAYKYGIVSEDGLYLTVGSWDGNSSNALQKHLMATGAASASVNMTSYDACPQYGGDGYFYYTQGNSAIRRFPIEGAAGAGVDFVTATNSGSPSSSYPLFGTNNMPASNGERCFIQASASGADTVHAFIVDAVTGEKLRTTNMGNSNVAPWNGGSSARKIVPFFDETIKRWKAAYLPSATTPNLTVLTIPESSTTPATDYIGPFAGAAGNKRFTALGDAIVAFNSSETGRIYTYDTDMSGEQVLNLNNVVSGINSSHQISYVRTETPTQLEIDARTYANPSVAVRVTGVETSL